MFRCSMRGRKTVNPALSLEPPRLWKVRIEAAVSLSNYEAAVSLSNFGGTVSPQKSWGDKRAGGGGVFITFRFSSTAVGGNLWNKTIEPRTFPFWRHICLLWFSLEAGVLQCSPRLGGPLTRLAPGFTSCGTLGEDEGLDAFRTGPQRWGCRGQFPVGFQADSGPTQWAWHPPQLGVRSRKMSCTVSMQTCDSSWVSLAQLPIQNRTGLLPLWPPPAAFVLCGWSMMILDL